MSKIVSWKEDDPTSFVIHSVNDFKREVIPKYFESSISSFKRQLNYYGFIKLHDANPAVLLRDEKKKDGCLSWTYRHEHGWLCKGERDLLQNIRRASSHRSPSDNDESSSSKKHVSRCMISDKKQNNCTDAVRVTSLQNEVEELRTKLTQIESKMTIYQQFMEDQVLRQDSERLYLGGQLPLPRSLSINSTRWGNGVTLPRSRSTHWSGQLPLPRNLSINSTRWVDEVPLPRSRSTKNEKSNDSNGIERLNTNDSTSSTQWAMLKDILMDGNSCHNPFPHDHSLSCYKENVSMVTGLDTIAKLDMLSEASVIVDDHTEEV